MLRTEKTNDPALIARQPAMTSVNSALQVDLFAQVNASRIGRRVWSGFGGQTDFIVGALHAPDGQALIALRSWHQSGSSTIVPLLYEPVTSFQPTAVITENGVADILGHDEKTQAAHLIEHAAHPRTREELRDHAAALGLAAPPQHRPHPSHPAQTGRRLRSGAQPQAPRRDQSNDDPPGPRIGPPPPAVADT